MNGRCYHCREEGAQTRSDIPGFGGVALHWKCWDAFWRAWLAFRG